VSAGNEALMRAVDGFDPQKGKFSSYAVPAIEREISLAVMKRRHPIYIPEDKLSELHKFRRIQAIKRKYNGREPTDSEVMERIDIEVSKIPELRWLAGLEFVSMDQPVNLDNPVEITPESPQPLLHEALPSPHPGVEEEVFTRKQREVIREELATLAPQEREILELHYGLTGEEEMTPEEIGQALGFSTRKVWQIEAQALRKLRHPSHNQKLKEFLS
jgi:RNA polymerase primary sigma factor